MVSISALLVLLLLMIPIAIAEGTALSVVIPGGSTKVKGETFTVDIKLDNVANLTTYQLNITWSNAKLECTDDNIYPVWDDCLVWPETKEDRINNTVGLYTVVVTDTDWVASPPFTGSTTLVTLSYRAIGTGTTDIEFIDETLLVNSTDQNIDCTKNKGTVYISTPSTGGNLTLIDHPEPSTYSLDPRVLPIGALAGISIIAIVAVYWIYRKR